MKDIAIVTNDQRLVEKIRLSLLGEARVFGLYEAPINPEAYDKLLFDLRGERRASVLTSSYGDTGFDGIDIDEYATVVSDNSNRAGHGDTDVFTTVSSGNNRRTGYGDIDAVGQEHGYAPRKRDIGGSAEGDVEFALSEYATRGDELTEYMRYGEGVIAEDRASSTGDADLARELGGIVIRWREDVGEGELPYPFTYRRKKVRLFIESERVARLDARTIKLTEVEGRLLRLLVDGGGEFVSREELAKKVWGENADGGVLNVYIHYLREKLEAGGEKIILSSRKGGYRIDERFLGGKDADAD